MTGGGRTVPTKQSDIKRSVTALHQIDNPFCIAIREKTWSENLPIGKRVEGSLSIPGVHVTGSTCKNGL